MAKVVSLLGADVSFRNNGVIWSDLFNYNVRRNVLTGFPFKNISQLVKETQRTTAGTRQLNFLERKFKTVKCAGIKLIKETFFFFYLAVISYANSTCKVKKGEDVDDSCPQNSFTA